MDCEIFMIRPSGDLICSDPKEWVKVGTVYNPPPGLSGYQITQISDWVKVSKIAHRVAPIFSLASYGEDHVEVETRFRVPATAIKVSKELDGRLLELFNDIKGAGWRTALDWARVDNKGGEPVIVRRLTVYANPRKDDLLGIELVLGRVWDFVEATRLGDHVMDPAEEWWVVREAF